MSESSLPLSVSSSARCTLFPSVLSSQKYHVIFLFAAQVVPGILVVLIGYLGCSIVASLIVWFVAVTLITAAYAGAMANIVDIAPNFAGNLLLYSLTFNTKVNHETPKLQFRE